MKQCPLSSHPLDEDGRCVSHACPGYSHPERMQAHADWLAKEKNVYLEGWTTPPGKQDPEKPSHTRGATPRNEKRGE